MALKKCKECGAEISTKANACPFCGAPIKSRTKIGFVGALILIIAIGFVGSQISQCQEKDKEAKRTAQQAE
jgi:RNA polymerase subunit RPABC4/transcription elongation factor Spt4